MATIILKGNPLSTNNIYRHTGNRTYMTTQGKLVKEAYCWELLGQWRNKPLSGDLDIQVKLFFGDKRKRDIDNFHKLSFDALTGIVWEDDSQIEHCEIIKLYDKENPRIEISIEELPS